jgi:hypothetical protein
MYFMAGILPIDFDHDGPARSAVVRHAPDSLLQRGELSKAGRGAEGAPGAIRDYARSWNELPAKETDGGRATKSYRHVPRR